MVRMTQMTRMLLIASLLLSACGRSDDGGGKESGAAPAPMFKDLGSHHHPITTKSELAQKYFDQGLILAYAFNHAEAERSFREAARLDPDCAMCYWGAAFVLGPNINSKMDPAQVGEAYKLTQKALELAPKATEKERAYIEALSKRYAAEPPADRKPLDLAFADAMRDVVRRFPDDLDAATIFAESVADTSPWRYWKKDGSPEPWTPEILTTLESVLARNPDHPGAIHIYIHAVEASPDPGRAERYADRLPSLVPGAGHLVHMPAHIYMRVGRYHDATLANQRAMKADESYLAQCHAQGAYPLAYVPHNAHFLWASAAMEGASAEAIRAARETVVKTDHSLMRESGLETLQHYTVTPLFALVRFGRWDDILKEPAPPADLIYPQGVWRYARGRAFTAKGQLDNARAELKALEEAAANKTIEKITIWDLNSAQSVLNIAVEVLAGELALASGKVEEGIRRLQRGAALEDELIYNEPPDWFYPVRHSLGAALLQAGRAAAAERVYREDLARFPENGWSLIGLAKALEAQRKNKEAQEVMARFKTAWQWADVTLTGSRF